MSVFRRRRFVHEIGKDVSGYNAKQIPLLDAASKDPAIKKLLVETAVDAERTMGPVPQEMAGIARLKGDINAARSDAGASGDHEPNTQMAKDTVRRTEMAEVLATRMRRQLFSYHVNRRPGAARTRLIIDEQAFAAEVIIADVNDNRFNATIRRLPEDLIVRRCVNLQQLATAVSSAQRSSLSARSKTTQRRA